MKPLTAPAETLRDVLDRCEAFGIDPEDVTLDRVDLFVAIGLIEVDARSAGTLAPRGAYATQGLEGAYFDAHASSWEMIPGLPGVLVRKRGVGG